MTTENSVLFNLRELQDLEADRIHAEALAAEAEKQRQAEVAASLAAQAEAERARRELEYEAERERAREAARLDVERQVEGRTKVAESRVNALRRELDQIRAEREELHRRVLAGTPALHEPAAPRRWPAVLSASAFALAAGVLVALLVPRPAPEVLVREVRVEVERAPREAPAPAPTLATAEVPPAEVTPAAEPAPRAGTRPRREPRPTKVNTDALRLDDGCGDDPICGAF